MIQSIDAVFQTKKKPKPILTVYWLHSFSCTGQPLKPLQVFALHFDLQGQEVF